MISTLLSSPDMTSVPPKVHPTLLHHHDSSQRNREIMPACVATSFAHMDNNVYKHEYSREDMLMSDTASSPESEKSEASVKRDTSNRYGNSFDKYESTSENRIHNHASSRVPATKCTVSQNDTKTLSKSPSLKSLDNENATKTISQPIKKRMLFGSTEPSKSFNSSKEALPSGNLSPSAFKPIGNAKRNGESNLTHNSSDILRQMYATFGSTRGLPNFSLRNSIDNLSSSNQHEFNRANQTSNQDLKPNMPHKHKRKAGTSNFQETAKNKNVENQLETGNSASPPKRARTLSNTSDHSQQNGKRGLKTYKNHKSVPRTDSHQQNSMENNLSNGQVHRRRISREYTSSPPPRQNHKRLVEENKSKSKRIRLNSSEQGFNDGNSPGSPNISPHPLSEMYKHGGLGFPYMNPLLFNPAALAAYGLPGTGLPVGMPGLTQPNPLNSAPNPVLFGANPYLNNSVLLREMLNQGSMFANHGLTQYPMHGGLTLEQMQAFQYLNNPALLHTSAMLGHGMLNPAAAALSAASLQSSFLQKNPNLLSPPSKPNNFSSEYRTNHKLPRANNFRDDTSEPRDHQSNHSGSFESNSPVFNESYSNRESAILTPLHDQRNNFSAVSKARSGISEHKEAYHQPPSHKVQSKNHKRHSKPNSKVEKKRQDGKVKEKSKPKPPAPKPKLNDMINYENNERLDYNDEDRELSMLDASTVGSNCSSGNYKNLTRERRLVANARERTRVHTISSAFDELRAQIPSYSCNQKLSKLAILRIACSYIRTLSVMAGHDETITFPQGVDQCTKVLQSESRARSRRKSNKAQIEWEMVNYEHRSIVDDNNNIAKDDDSPKPATETPHNTKVRGLTPEVIAKDSEVHEAVENCHEIDVESVENESDDVTNHLMTSHEEQNSPKNCVDNQPTSAGDAGNAFHGDT